MLRTLQMCCLLLLLLLVLKEGFLVEPADCYSQLLRLVGGQVPNEGRLEVFYNGRWGTVCQRHFNVQDGHVACRQLGYSQAVSVRYYAYKYYGLSKGPIFLDNIQCMGSEPSLLHCGHHKFESFNCRHTHKHDVGLVCYSEKPQTICDYKHRTNYRVCLFKARYNAKKKIVCGGVRVLFGNRYGTICDDHADIMMARVICRQLGYTGAQSMYTCGLQCGGASLPIWLNNLDCKGTETTLRDCHMSGWGRHDCKHSEDVGVCCRV